MKAIECWRARSSPLSRGTCTTVMSTLDLSSWLFRLYAMRVVGEVPVGGLLVVKLLFSKEGVQERINEYLIKVIILHIFSALLFLQNEELSPQKVQKF